MRPSIRTTSLLLSAAALLSGCATYEEKSNDMARNLESGGYTQAASKAKSGLEDADDRDKLVWKLEYAACERATGNWQASAKAFDDAEADLRKWDETPDILISSESAATLVNLTYLPYRGTAYDRIMVATYRAMNELALGHIDRARVELNHTINRQQEATEFAKRQVEAARAEAAEAKAKGKEGVNADRSASDPKIGALYGDLKSYRLYGDYVNPFPVWLHGIFFLATSEGNSDIERAHKSLERLHALVPDCAAAKADYELAKSLRNGEPLPPTVWIVFESGMGPRRVQTRVDIPLFIVSDTVPYAGIALPKLEFHPGNATLAVEAGNKTLARTETVASMDAIVATDFDNEKSVIITRTIVTAGLKVAAQYAANAAARRIAEERQDSIGALIYLSTYVASGAITYATTEADLRTWRSLPKNFQIARVTPPADGRLYLRGSSPQQSAEITLPPGSAHIVFAKSTSDFSRLTVSVTTLRK